ncbi:class I SAM-dependent methyltransferase [Yinghuangia seranimata]|uniref:class I SAM-dependent methyltransferase n=1 Tax=Yinghuangia seranimata TaxID=408067 RepID=UPI00248C05E3|nr:class I SAM-dependent methyltransferase [Yinghuangia seranimata]MDI2130985.1 class I SAM-dependent methyltransferase [Yinghuangia seranimata]
MGFYADNVLPRLLDFACGVKSARPLRERVCAGLTGEIVEIGFGSGHNVPFYPPEVTGVAAVEPSDLAWRLAADCVAASRTPIRRAGLDGQSLPFPDATFDAALSTWTLCTIPDPTAALRELRRVLKPGAPLHFLEHGLASEHDPNIRRWQHRLEPINKAVLGGCHLTRPMAELITTAGFHLTRNATFYDESAPKPMSYMTLGTAVAT